VAKVCALGDATSCTCEDEGLDLPESGGSTEYEMGCSDNVGFGINFATQFLRRRHSGSGLIQDIEAHNMHTGAKVSKEYSYQCLLMCLHIDPPSVAACSSWCMLSQRLGIHEALITKLQECLICTLGNSEIAQG
jgi:hypothetical protein